MEVDGDSSNRPRKNLFALTLVAAIGLGLGIGWLVGRSPKSTVGPLVEELRLAGYTCDPMRTSNDGIMNSFAACQSDGVRLEVSSQPTDQAHDELVRFTVEDMGCPLARSRNQPGFTLYTRDQTVVYEFGVGHRFASLFDDFTVSDVECVKKPGFDA